MHTASAPAVWVAAKTELSFRNNSVIVFFFAQLTKMFWRFLNLNMRILGLIWPGTTYFVQNNTFYLATLGELQASCKTRSTHFWRQIRCLETQNVSRFSLFTIWYVFLEIEIPIYCQRASRARREAGEAAAL